MMIKGANVVVGNKQSTFEKATLRGNLTAATDNTAGGVLKLQNPFGIDVYVNLFLVDVTTKSTGAATADFGVDDAGDTSNDTLIDGVDVGTAAITASNLVGGGTNGKIVRWKKDEYIVGTASASVAGVVGTYYIEVVPAN